MELLNQSRPLQPEPGRRRLGLPVIMIVALALLAVPRVVLHDLGLLTEGTAVNALFVFLPPVIWIAVALWKRVPNAFLTLLAIGALYGVFLAVGHQILWEASFGEVPPRLGGNLSNLDPGVQAVMFRFFAAISSLFTGVVVGAITGVIGWGVQVLSRGRAA